MSVLPPLRIDGALGQVPQRVDVLVIGAGITGAGVALDAAHRGASVLLVDRGDLASGTSSRSSRLVHGGARYLATGDVAMVAEGVRERERLRRMLPHLVLPLPFVLPADTRTDLALLRIGMTAYDALAVGRGVAPHRRLRPAEVLAAAPSLTGGFRHGGVRYFDCRTDDARLTLEVARGAAAHGATVAPHVAVTALEGQRGRIGRAHLHDQLSGERRAIDVGTVVSAAGVWAGEVHGLPAGDVAAEPLSVVAARGIHLVFDRADLPVNDAVVLPSAAGDDRRLFAIPWGSQVYVGTTDDPHHGPLDELTVTSQDADYVLATLRAALGVSLDLDDVVGAWAGLRPLLRGRDGAATADLSRRHAIVTGPPGLLSITGGKLTTFRAMAADVVDRLAAEAGWPRRSGTADLRLGSAGPVAADRARVRAAAVAAGVDPWYADGLHHRHGTRALALLEAAREHDETAPLVPGLPYLRAEVRWAARHERVGRLDDVLSRRLRLSTRHRAAGGDEAVTWAAATVGDELGWDADRQAAEIAAYREAVRAERGAVPLVH